jgi:SAM-dependent methyltransferase
VSFSAAAERNRAPILEVLQRLLPARASVLEIAAGTGQHAEHFAAAQPQWHWQPTDADASALATIDARCRTWPNVAPALRLDVMAAAWPVAPSSVDVVYAANLLHIAPWPVCRALMAGAARSVRPGGRLLLYGPFRVDGQPTAPSNEAFDTDLKARNPAWGLRRLSDVEHEADAAGLQQQQTIAMPANNLLLAFGWPA